MPPRRRAFKVPFTILVTLGLTSLGGCTYEQEGPPEAHFEEFDAKPPKLDTVWVCHAYGCKEQTPFAFSQADIAEISAVMARVPRNDSPSEERRAIAYSIAWMERRVAPTVGTATDRPSMDFGGSGDPTQQDCVDEATNTTSYLLLLERHGLLHNHTVERPFAKDSPTHWTHWAAVIKETDNGERFAIDSSAGANGENPTVQAAASFYVPDSSADNTPPESSLAPADTNGNAAAKGAGRLTGMLQRRQSLGYADSHTGSSR